MIIQLVAIGILTIVLMSKWFKWYWVIASKYNHYSFQYAMLREVVDQLNSEDSDLLDDVAFREKDIEMLREECLRKYARFTQMTAQVTPSSCRGKNLKKKSFGSKKSSARSVPKRWRRLKENVHSAMKEKRTRKSSWKRQSRSKQTARRPRKTSVARKTKKLRIVDVIHFYELIWKIKTGQHLIDFNCYWIMKRPV